MDLLKKEKIHLSARGLLETVRKHFSTVPGPLKSNAGNKPKISLTDCLMSGLAVFSLKFPSLLKFDQAKNERLIGHNLKSLYGVERAPSDTQMRERLDEVDPQDLRRAFKKIFAHLQRGKVLERYRFLDEYYLLLADGTGHFHSKSVHCPNCCTKQHSDGSISYYHQVLGGAIVHPDYREVIPICPEPIRNGDGQTKNDCERNASKRLLSDLRREHPHLQLILVEDALASNAPHLRLCQDLDIRFITVVKPRGNKSLFEWLKGIQREQCTRQDSTRGRLEKVEYVNAVPLNDTNSDLLVNFIEYKEFDANGKGLYHNTWVTDIPVTPDNAFKIARGGRARWKIENETFNTLKNQGYEFEHNFGHGNKNLCTVFSMLMILAFLIDQAQQICCTPFQAALNKCAGKQTLWEKMRNAFQMFRITSWVALYQAIAQANYGQATLDTS